MIELVQNSFTFEGVLFEGAISKESILKIKNFQGNPTDIYLSTYPRTGTTWTQNILIGLVFGLDKLRNCGPSELRMLFPYLEFQSPTSRTFGYERVKLMTESPRLFKHHLPTHLAPQEIFSQKRKNIVVVRNPKDTAVSLDKFYRNNPIYENFRRSANLNQFLDFFLEGEVIYGSWWNWNREWVKYCR